ncbi:MAG: SMP-30/gluconolactonase/LRE family protein [Chitinophagaceae bacterium]|nr:MAG: SMP-30/gluconolactonase/LRE family protein [Chitinophagaceae bacterium]
MLRPIYLLCLTALACAGPKSNSGTAASGSFTDDTLHLVSDQFVFTEGPAVAADGSVYFTDQPRNQIWKYDRDGKLSLFLEPAGRANGLYIQEGKILACADQDNELWSIDPDGKKSVILKGPPGKAFNGPNDLWIDKQGGIWFTDPYYQRDYWTRKSADLAYQGVYYLAPGAKQALLLDSTMTKPNGIVGSADGKRLYVSDIGAGKTYVYRIESPGKLTDRRLFVNQGSDGMTIDRNGNLYLSGKGVTAWDGEGREAWHVDVPAGWVGNICFAGVDRNILFITASKAVYVIRMNTGGIE